MLISVAYGETSGNAQAGDPPALPLRIDGTRQLFVDDMLIDRMENCRRVIHPGKKDSRNPLIDEPGEKP
ncbi:MAG: hypothetical protein U9N87_05945, partial [Planctomycetota bacterium]|nr:hypothetical protein [Planctomycetota bacterium]